MSASLPELTTLAYEVRDRVGWVTLDRPEKLNAMSRAFWIELPQLLSHIEQDDDVAVVVFRGAGRCFSAGGDIESFGELGDARGRRDFSDEALRVMRLVEDFPKPTIAAVHGYALGGGCELTMVCDIVVADETATFGTPEVSVGLMPGLAVVRGRAHLNLHWMKYLVFTGERLDAHQALQAGLVNVVTPAGRHEAEAGRLAAIVAAKAPLGLRAAKRILNRGSEEGYSYSTEAMAFLQGTEDQAEGVRAFSEKRTPVFRGA